jgi:hypothetical protein
MEHKNSQTPVCNQMGRGALRSDEEMARSNSIYTKKTAKDLKPQKRKNCVKRCDEKNG